MRRIAVTMSVLCGLLATPGMSLAAASWADTATSTLSMGNAVPLGPALAGMPMHVIVTLKPRNEAQLDSFIASITTPGSPAFGSWLSAQAYRQSYLPSAASAQAVAAYLEQAGFAGVAISDNRMLVSADGTAAQVNAAFNTRIDQFQAGGRTVFANVLKAQVPAALGGVVNAVLGLQNAATASAPRAVTDLPGPSATAATAGAEARSLFPPLFQLAYDVQSTPAATRTTGAIITLVDGQNVLSDLRLEEAINNQPQTPVVIKLVAASDPAGGGTDGEFDLDSQASSSIAGGFAQLMLYGERGQLANGALPLAAVNQWVSDDLAKTASMSMGFCEEMMRADGTMAAMDAALKQAVAQGQTFFVGSGDSGAFCGALVTNGSNAGVPSVTYPASSPYAVAVGGTDLATFPDFSYGGESGWAASGGGFSVFETAPAWQSAIPAAPGGGKNVPDIAMDSVPGMVTINDGAVELSAGGTSLAAPLAMGAWARLESANDNRLGFAAPLFYALYANGTKNGNLTPAATGFHDIATTDSSSSPVLYPAGKGYDQLTGIGSIDICRMANLLRQGAGADLCARPSQPPPGTDGSAAVSTTTAQVCTAPGMSVAGLTPSSASLKALKIAEPAGSDKMVFTLDIEPGASLPVNVKWTVQFASPDRQFRFVRLDTSGASGTPQFVYGIITDSGYQVQGQLDPASAYSAADGIVTLVADKSTIGAPAPGSELAYLWVDISGLVGVGGVSAIPNATTSATYYVLRSTGLCGGAGGASRSGVTSSASSGGAVHWGVLALMGLAAAARRRRMDRRA